MKWISVKERLPEVSKTNHRISIVVIVANAKYVTVGYFNIKTKKCELPFGSLDATHWMPLPELPK